MRIKRAKGRVHFPEFALLMHLAQAKAHNLAITLPPGTIEKVANIVLRALLAEKEEKIANMSKKLETMEQKLAEKTSLRAQMPIEYPPSGAICPPANGNTPWQMASQVIVVMRASGSFSSGREWYQAPAEDPGEQFGNWCRTYQDRTIPTKHILRQKWKATKSMLDMGKLTAQLDS